MNKEKVIRPNRKKLDTQRRRKLKMTRNEILSALKPYFKISELVCPHTLTKWGERSWQFLDTAFLHNLLIIRRDILQAPMICNTSTQTQRDYGVTSALSLKPRPAFTSPPISKAKQVTS